MCCNKVALWYVLLAFLAVPVVSAQEPEVKRGDAKTYEGPHGLKVMVRVMVPQEQETDLLCLCFFKHKKEGDTVLDVIQEFDDRLGGVIAALRNRGEFSGEALQTIVITPKAGSIKAKQLMLIGLGEEKKLSLQTMRKIGHVVGHEVARLGVKSVAFGAALRDQGNDKYDTGDVGREVVHGAMLAFDTETRLQKEGLGTKLALAEFIYLAGPKYFPKVFPRVSEGLTEAIADLKARSGEPYSKSK